MPPNTLRVHAWPRPTTGVLLAPCHDEFRGPQSDYIRQVALATTTIHTQQCYYSILPSASIIPAAEVTILVTSAAGERSG
ncbi:hypothetical protein TNCV_4302051 [Trichonephila clavipes]|uniref:Uncharacterized protein n=1 Tax=Trichonephila clavipes TaxID=2585209 RepID=A0A8X6RYX9_TRICX|nr:hypothetical protein TNCV_4302051 [Trichonephila clavipes]